jgi:hypothetical protein
MSSSESTDELFPTQRFTRTAIHEVQLNVILTVEELFVHDESEEDISVCHCILYTKPLREFS